MNPLQHQLSRFAAQGAARRAQAWAGSATVSGDLTARTHSLALSAPTTQRTAAEFGAGWIEATTRTIMVRRSLGLTLALGTTFSIVADPVNPHTIGTVWQIRELTDSDCGSEQRCVCFRLDLPAAA